LRHPSLAALRHRNPERVLRRGGLTSDRVGPRPGRGPCPSIDLLIWWSVGEQPSFSMAMPRVHDNAAYGIDGKVARQRPISWPRGHAHAGGHPAPGNPVQVPRLGLPREGSGRSHNSKRACRERWPCRHRGVRIEIALVSNAATLRRLASRSRGSACSTSRALGRRIAISTMLCAR